MILVSSAFGGFLVTFMSSGINIGLTTINQEFDVSAVFLNWISLSMVLVSAAVLLPFGRLADVYGRMRFFIAGMVIFTVASFASALAPSATVLLGLADAHRGQPGHRVGDGPGVGDPGLPAGDAGKGPGWSVAGVYLGVTLGPVLGGFIFSLRLAQFLLHPRGGQPGERDPASLEAAAPRVAGAQAGTVRCGRLGHLCRGPCRRAARLLAPAQRRGDRSSSSAVSGGWPRSCGGRPTPADPLLPVSLLRHNRVFAFSNGAVFVNYAATAAMSLLMSYYLLVDRGLSPGTAGLVLAAGSFVQAVFSPVAGRLADRVPARYVASAGMGLTVVGLFALIFLGPATPYWYIILFLCLLQLGFAFFSTPITYSIMGSVDKSRVGIASATISAVRQAGMNLSLGVATMLIALYVGGMKIQPENYPAVARPAAHAPSA